MKSYGRRIAKIMKVAVICIAITASLFLELDKSQLYTSCQSFDLKSASVISVGFGTAVSLILYDNRKDKFHHIRKDKFYHNRKKL